MPNLGNLVDFWIIAIDFVLSKYFKTKDSSTNYIRSKYFRKKDIPEILKIFPWELGKRKSDWSPKIGRIFLEQQQNWFQPEVQFDSKNWLCSHIRRMNLKLEDWNRYESICFHRVFRNIKPKGTIRKYINSNSVQNTSFFRRKFFTLKNSHFSSLKTGDLSETLTTIFWRWKMLPLKRKFPKKWQIYCIESSLF